MNIAYYSKGYLAILVIIVLSLNACVMTEKESRLQVAIKEKDELVQKYLEDAGIKEKEFEIILLAHKAEQLLTVYAKAKSADDYKPVVEYPFCTFSGTLGPKLKEGDKQIPEGFYKIDRFNERSKFYLSLGLDYPTLDDLKLADAKKPGSDIFIHGGCSSVGCIAISDDKIKELYLLALKSTKPIEVIILPFQYSKDNFQKHLKQYPEWESFWNALFKRFNAHSVSSWV